MLKSVKKLNFWWSIQQKWTSIGHFSARDHWTIKWYIFWWNEAVEVIEATEAFEAGEVTEAAEVLRPEKSLLRTSEFTRFSNSALLWCFETIFILVESWNIKLIFSAFPFRGCWGGIVSELVLVGASVGEIFYFAKTYFL